MVTKRAQRSRDTACAHYTTSAPIVSYMVSRLRVGSHDLVWEPCAGHGHLVEGLVAQWPELHVRCSETDEAALEVLSRKFSRCRNVTVCREDALCVGDEGLFDKAVEFTRIIGNPPYGAWQDFARRRSLKRRFRGVYVRETYAVFLYHALNVLQSHGRLVFIIPDTFLSLHRHEQLRRWILQECTVEELCFFPSKFFPGVSFGYSGLCVVSISKARPDPHAVIRLISGLRDPGVLHDLAADRDVMGRITITQVRQEDVSSSEHAELVVSSVRNQGGRRTRAGVSLGDVAQVVTGFYSGNDRRWVRCACDSVRGAARYTRITEDEIWLSREGSVPPLSGLPGKRKFIPLVRGGAAAYVKPTVWYVDWSVDAVREYRRSGPNPARF